MKERPDFILHLQGLLGEGTIIRDVTRIYGGYINRTYRLSATTGSFLVKVNSAEHFPEMFASEAAGLQLLADSRTVSIPAVIAHGRWEDLTYLLLEWIDTAETPPPGTMALLGRQLAEMHRHSAPRFGLSWDHKAWLVQSNAFHDGWTDFFIRRRLQPTLMLAMEKGNLTMEDDRKFRHLYTKIPELFPREPPALLHRIDLCNLYPLLILTVFGPDYRDQLRAALARYL
jgi:fructosamine-3-kinase